MTRTRKPEPTSTPEPPVICHATKADGTPCATTFGLSPEGYCFPHDPLRQVEWNAMQKARSDLSSKRRKAMRESLPPGLPRAPKTLDDAVQWSSWAMHAVAAGIIDARTGHEIGYLVNAFKAAVEKRDLQLEIARLSKQIAELRSKPTRVA